LLHTEKGKALDLLHRPVPSAAPTAKKWPPLTLATLPNGFDTFHAVYFRGKRLRMAYITDRKMLDRLAAALTVVKQEADKPPQKRRRNKSFLFPKEGR
jgi:hypothetical protein